MHREHIKGEEGVDYMIAPGGIEDPSRPSEKLLEKQLRREINQLKMENPEAAKEYETYLF